MKKVAVIMGSDSDLPVVRKAIDILREYGVPMEAHVFSAHRCPAEAAEFARNARNQGIGVIIAAAGKAAHLAGAIAANTTLPVLIAPSDALVHKCLTIIVDVMRIEPKNIVESRKKLLLLAERELNTVNDIINPHIS